MPGKHTNLRELISKWGAGNVGKVLTQRGELARDDFVDLNGTLGKIAHVDCTGVHYRKVDVTKRRLSTTISTTTRPAFDVLYHKEGEGY